MKLSRVYFPVLILSLVFLLSNSGAVSPQTKPSTETPKASITTWSQGVRVYFKQEGQSSQQYFQTINLDLNHLGSLGWELVSFEPEMRANANTVAYIAVFKHPGTTQNLQ